MGVSRISIKIREISIRNQFKIVVPLLLHQIKALQFYTNFLVLISPFSQSSISEVEF